MTTHTTGTRQEWLTARLGNEVGLLEECPALLAYMKRMYDRPKAAMRIKDALASVGAAA